MYLITRIILLCSLLISQSAFAGSTSRSEIILDPEEIKIFAKNVEKYAASLGARAFIISRLGQPQSNLPKGIQFTHTAIAIYSKIKLSNGKTVRGYAIHNLYQDDKIADASNLVVDYPVDFFWGVYELKTGIIIPTKELQQRLINTIAKGDNKALHNPKYSFLSNPYNSKLQNCTEHTLDIINASIYQTTNIQQLKLNARAHFKRQQVKKSLKLLFGRIFRKDIKTNDHKGKIYTATFTTINDYLNANNLAMHSVIYKQGGEITDLY